MPGSMIHLMVAKQVNFNCSISFLVGNVAQDAVVDLAEKERVHFRQIADREAALKALAKQAYQRDSFDEGILLHLYCDWRWDIKFRDLFMHEFGAEWFSKYQEELRLAGSHAYHETEWAEKTWIQMDEFNIADYGMVNGATKEQVKDFIHRNRIWHHNTVIGPSKFFSPKLISDFTNQVAGEYEKWIGSF